jgi:site-specific recombinase XerC
LGQQRTPRFEKVVRIEDGEPGLSARTIARRLSSVAGLFEYLIVRGDAGVEGIWSRAGWSPAGRIRAAFRSRHVPKNEKFPAVRGFSSGPWRDRTSDLGIKSPLLYQLS